MANGFQKIGENTFLLDTIQASDPEAGQGQFPVIATRGPVNRGDLMDYLRYGAGASFGDPFAEIKLRGSTPGVSPGRVAKSSRWHFPNPTFGENASQIISQIENQFGLPTETTEVPEGGFGLEQLAAGGIQPDPMKQGPIAETMLDEGAARVFDRGDDFMVAGPGWNDTFQDRGAAMSAFEEQFGGGGGQQQGGGGGGSPQIERSNRPPVPSQQQQPGLATAQNTPGGGQQQQQQQFLPALPAATPQPQQSGRGQQMQTGGQQQGAVAGVPGGFGHQVGSGQLAGLGGGGQQGGGQDQFSPSPSQRLGGQPQNPLGGIGMQQLGQLFQQLFGRGPQLGGFGGGRRPLGPVPFAGGRGMMRRPLPPVQMRSPFGRF